MDFIFSLLAAPFIYFQLVVEGAAPGMGATPAVALPQMQSHSAIDLVLAAGPVVKGVMLLLALMSIVSWGIVISKTFQLRTAKGQTKKFSDIFWGSRNLAAISEAAVKLGQSPVASVFAAGYRELTQLLKAGNGTRDKNDFGDIDNIDRALKRARVEEITRLEYGTTFLATTASAAPFIGLFGTVWGIMDAFLGLAQVKTTSIQAVAPGISEALIATAIGLAAAIPAAIAYNYFNQQVRVLGRSMEMFSAEFLNIARRHFLT